MCLFRNLSISCTTWSAALRETAKAMWLQESSTASSRSPSRPYAARGATIFHVTGAFHSDFGQGTVDRVRRRVPAARILVITGVPVPDPATAVDSARTPRADFLIFTRVR